MKTIIPLIGILISLASCNNQCKQCFVIQNPGTTTDTVFVNERCGNDEVNDFLNQNWVDITGAPIPSYCE